MTWDEARAALLLLAEERVGTSVRTAAAREDAALSRSLAVLRAEEARRAR